LYRSLDLQEKAKSFASGFFLSQEGVFVTARHVAQAEEKLVAITQDGKKFPVTGFIGEDRDYDIAVLKIERSKCSHLRLANGMLKTNQPVALVSAQDMIASACSTGIVAAVISLPVLFETVATTVPVRAGQSGSPLLNPEGDVVGMVPYLSPTESATASPIAVIQELWLRPGPTHRPRSAGGQPTAAIYHCSLMQTSSQPLKPSGALTGLKQSDDSNV
jgi:S1-C subfamily serine protease